MDYTQLTDGEIIRHLVQGPNPRLFEELVSRHQSRVLQQCRQQLKDTEAAYDVSQEVWIRVHTKLSQFQVDRPFPPWLSVIVHRRCYDHLHKDKHLLYQEISQQIVDGLKEDEAIDTENLSVPTVEILEELMEQLGGKKNGCCTSNTGRAGRSKLLRRSCNCLKVP